MMKAKNKGVKITLATDLVIAHPDDACSKDTNVCTIQYILFLSPVINIIYYNNY